MSWFSRNSKAICSFLETGAPSPRRASGTSRRATFETLSPREMLSASSGRMIGAHSPAISASPVAGQPAMVSACSHSSPTGSSAANLVAHHLASGGTQQIIRSINGGAKLTKVETDTLALSGVPTYHRGMMVSAGTLTINAATINILEPGTVTAGLPYVGGILTTPGAGTLTIANGTWTNGTLNQHVGTIALNPGTVNLNPGTVSLTPGTINLNGGSLWSSGTGTLEIAGKPTLGNYNYNTVSVNAGTLKLNNDLVPATVGSGVTANVSVGNTVELAGSVSTLGTPIISNGTMINNSSTGTHTVDLNSPANGTYLWNGAIDGTENTTIVAGSGLTANHIVQNVLVIGGDAMNQSPVTIPAADSSGSSLVPLNGFGLTAGAPFTSYALDTSSLLAASGASSTAV